MDLKITILGSGTSTGVPTLGCKCETCSSDDPRDTRLRTSIMVESKNSRIIIDSSVDFRQQMIREKVDRIDAIIYTHQHFDHIGGFDDIRGYNFSMQESIPIYLNQMTLEHLKTVFPYAFGKSIQKGGGVPEINAHIIEPYKKFNINDLEIEPIALMHGKLEILGFKIKDFAYCTDTNFIPENSNNKLMNLKLLILDALRPEKHTTHYNLQEAIEKAKELNSMQTIFIHIAHQMKHSKVEKILPKNIKLSYDGMKIEI